MAQRSCSRWLPAFAMIEVVAAMAIATLFSVYFFSTLLMLRRMHMENVTESNAEFIMQSLSNYVLQNGMLPYPALPQDGVEYEYPTSEEEWSRNPQAYMRGVIPYQTLGIDPRYAKDGYGMFFTYIVNPTLCGRKNAINVPPGDMREALDYTNMEEFATINLHMPYSVSIINTPEALDRYLQNGRHEFLQLKQQKYSSFSAVRTYDSGYTIDSDSDKYKGWIGDSECAAWDLVGRIPNTEIQCIYNGQLISCNRCFYLYPPIINKVLNSIATQTSVKRQIDTEYAMQAMKIDGNVPPAIENGRRFREKYKVSDTIAFVLISHGKSKSGAFCSDGTIAPMRPNASQEKIANGNQSVDKNRCYVNQNKDSKGYFDDKVYWRSRFMTIPLKPFPVNIIDVANIRGDKSG